MSAAAEQTAAVYVLIFVVNIGIVTSAVLVVVHQSRREAHKDPARIRFPSAVYGAMAYGCYLAAALLTGVRISGFLRNHLFDGLALAFLVGFLTERIPFEDAADAFRRWIRLPAFVCFWFYVGGAVVFGAIGAAAVFSSGSSDFTTPVSVTAVIGASLFLTLYAETAIDDVKRRDRIGNVGAAKWFFTRRAKLPRAGRDGDDRKADRSEPVTYSEPAGQPDAGAGAADGAPVAVGGEPAGLPVTGVSVPGAQGKRDVDDDGNDDERDH